MTAGETGTAQFWDAQFSGQDYRYGTAPNAFVAEQARHFPSGADIVELGAGEGRNAVWLAEKGYRVTAFDIAPVALAKTQRLAAERGVEVETALFDARTWDPGRTWDVAVCTFLHLGPDKRPALYRALQQATRPGGLIVAEWFRPAQRTDDYTSGGPPDVAMMVTLNELRSYFIDGDFDVAEEVEVMLEEGVHRGPAATVRLQFRRA